MGKKELLCTVGGSLNWLGQHLKIMDLAFRGGAVVKNLHANAGDMGSSPGPGRSHMLQRS